MKKLLASILFCAAAALVSPPAHATLSDVVHVTDDIYGNFDGIIAEGGPEAELTWQSAVFGAAFSIYLTEPGTGLISDVLFTDGNDLMHFVSDGGVHSALGQLCSAVATNPAAQCLQETGELQDVTAMIAPLNGGNGICCSENSRIFVQSDVDVPEPATLALVAIGVAGLGVVRRRRAA